MHRAPLYGTLAIAAVALAAPATAMGQSYPQPTYPVPPAPAAPAKFTAKLALARAQTLGGVLDVLAPITGRASGRASIEYFAAQSRNRFTAPIGDARLRFRRRLPSRQARLGTGILTINYPGDADTRPQELRLRAARNQANLDLSRPTIVANRLRASGRVTSRANGVVRLQLEYQFGSQVRTLPFRATIRDDGRWSLDQALTPQQVAEIALRTGTVHSYTLFTGYFPRRIRGEARSFQVLGNR